MSVFKVNDEMNERKQNRGQSRRQHPWKSLLVDYLANSTVAGCSNYVVPNRSPAERVIWVIVHLAAVLSMMFVIYDMTMDFWDSPTVTTMDTDIYPIKNVDYPGIAICSVNKISYKAALRYAEEILETDENRNFTVNEVVDLLKYMGHLYLFEMHQSEEPVMKSLHEILERRYNGYDVTTIMKALTPGCRSLLQYCSWDGNEQTCEDIFYIRKTMDGYCCTFNYARMSDDYSRKHNAVLPSDKILRTRITGPGYGLTVLLDPAIHDHYYKILPILGFKILIYPTLDYPDAPSGGLREVLVSPRSEVFLTLEPTTFYSIPDVAGYSVANRDCLFNTELSKIFGGYYSYSDCIMYCRIDDIIKLCECIPFFYPIQKENADRKICNLEDLPCLNKYKDKWWRVLPRYELGMVPFMGEGSDGTSDHLNCSACFPACQDVFYRVSATRAAMTASRVILGRKSYSVDNHSVLHVFFGKTGTVRLKQGVLYYWYDLIGNYGGICGLFLGISFISVVEFLYFFTLRLSKSKGYNKAKRRAIVVLPSSRLQPLYWPEMMHPNAKY